MSFPISTPHPPSQPPTSLPSLPKTPQTLASAFSPTLAAAFGTATAREQRAKGTSVMLGPCINIARVPWGGRTFEGFGEDPYLASQLVGPEVVAIQAEKVIANVKHYVANSQGESWLNVISQARPP